MTFVVTNACIAEKNKSCIDVCPVDCIYEESDELDQMVYINPDECIDCGACESACPVTAIFEESAVPDEWAEYIELNQRWFDDRDAVRLRVLELSTDRGLAAAG
ncbi:MAG TPA: ferredoxin family protein [Chloroflexota bacterium]|nr:ferredoxin family protein [Chloroflexota bacterium]